jgi:hypothetical protein
MPFQLLRKRRNTDSSKEDIPYPYLSNNVNTPFSLRSRCGSQDPKSSQRYSSFISVIRYLFYFSCVVAWWIPIALLIVPAIIANGRWLVNAVASLSIGDYFFTSLPQINFQRIKVFPRHNLNTMEMRLAKVEDYLGGPRRHRRNFALRGAGAHILDELTSPTHGFMSSTSKSWFKRLRTNIYNYEVNLPVITLEDQLYVGECWEFSGSKGHLAIVLPEAVQINGLSVTHVDPVLLSKEHVQRAPKNITLWGLIDLSCDGHSGIDQTTLRTASSFVVEASNSPAPPESHRFLPLLNFQFDIKSPSSTHYFKVVSPNARWWIDTVIIEVNDNWGAATTCMYHVGIHGDADVSCTE